MRTFDTKGLHLCNSPQVRAATVYLSAPLWPEQTLRLGLRPPCATRARNTVATRENINSEISGLNRQHRIGNPMLGSSGRTPGGGSPDRRHKLERDSADYRNTQSAGIFTN